LIKNALIHFQMLPSYEYIGKIGAISGLHGEVMLQHHLGKKSDFKNVKSIFLEMLPDSYIPYFIEHSRVGDMQQTWLKFDEIHSKETARALLHKKVYLLSADFEKNVAAKAPVAIIGYTVFQQSNKIGIIENVLESPQQVLLEVHQEGKEILIPLHEETLLKIDRKKKAVFVQLPDGLLDIF